MFTIKNRIEKIVIYSLGVSFASRLVAVIITLPIARENLSRINTSGYLFLLGIGLSVISVYTSRTKPEFLSKYFSNAVSVFAVGVNILSGVLSLMQSILLIA